MSLENSLPIVNGETTKQHRRPPRFCLGDLNSGRAFDNNCICFENIHTFRRQECTCNVSSIYPLVLYIVFLEIGTETSTRTRIYDSID